MKIPKSVRVGRKKYTVRKVDHVAKLGHISYKDAVIEVSRRYFSGELRSQYSQCETFWHELTHGILKDMDNPLHNDEAFVTAFAARLNAAVHSAEF